jgi:tetratricopeptide (TPR) repeat protein
VPGYEILSELGRGAMGVVYKARQIKANRLVALKMLRAGTQASDEEHIRFRIEAEAVARLHHPNIVQLYEVSEFEGQPFFSMEFVDGSNLRQLRLANPFSFRQAAELIEQLARAVHHAHERGIVHRDLKPANILLPNAERGTRNAESKTNTSSVPDSAFRVPHSAIPKITDFGLAKSLHNDSALTLTGDLLGTPAYMAPEQAQCHSQAVGPAVDIWALGAIFYELLTGRPAFRGASLVETLREVIDNEPASMRGLQLRVPRDLETICLKCLRKKPEQRYPTALDLADDLRHFLDGKPIRARPVGAWEWTAKWARRNPATAAALAASILLLVGLAAGGLWIADREHRRADREASLRADLSRERQIALAQNEQSRDNFRDALNAIEEMLDEVAHHRPEDVPTLLLLYRDLLSRAEDFYVRLTPQDPANVDERRETALARLRIGRIRLRLGQAAEALVLLEQALSGVDALLRDDPEQPDLWLSRADVHYNRGKAFELLGKMREAAAAQDEAVSCWQARRERFPQVPPVWPDLPAAIYLARGQRRAAEGQNAAAIEDFLTARTILKGLVQAERPPLRYRWKLACVDSALADAQAAQTDPAAADTYLEAAVLWKALAEERPHAVEFLLEQARALRKFGDLRLSTDARGAVTVLEQAVAVLRRLPAVYASLPVHRRELADTCRRLAAAYRAVGRIREADEVLGSIESDTKP